MRKKGVSERILEELGEENSCYVLITCSKPSESGQMEVDMTYQGDPTLAAYLVQGAQDRFEEDEEESFPLSLVSNRGKRTPL